MTKSQYKVLLKDLDKVLISISEKEIKQLLPQIELFLIESNVFGEYEEIDEIGECHPTEILRGQLIQISDQKELAKWYAILALYLAKEIENRKKQNDLNIVNYALHAINISKSYSDDAEVQKKQIKRKIRKSRSREGTESNKKRYETLNRLKKAAFGHYEPAIEELQSRRRSAKKRTLDDRTTYKNTAKIIFPKIVDLNEDKHGKKLIGRNGDPVGSLARILSEAAQAGHIKSTRGR